MSLSDGIEAIFPDYHPEDHVMSVTACCGSCKKGKNKTTYIECPETHAEMFPYGICPQYERNIDIIWPLIMHPVNSKYGQGQG